MKSRNCTIVELALCALALTGCRNLAQSSYEPYTFTTLAGPAASSSWMDGMGSAARFWNPSGVAVDSTGDIYVADTLNQTIRKVTPAGVVTTLAGQVGNSGRADGTGTDAQF